MKKNTAILLFFCCNALLIFFEVHKQGKYLKLSYEIQKLQNKITTLQKEHNDLMYVLQTLQQPDTIQKYVEKNLNMKPIELKSVRRIANGSNTL